MPSWKKNTCEDIARHLIKKHEGLVLFVYKCPGGKATIGYGRNLEDNGISKEEADILLENDLQKIMKKIYVTIPFFRTLDKVRQAVLIDMAYNMGISGLLQFRDFLQAVSVQNFERASHDMVMSKWFTQVGDRAVRLARMMKTGKLPR